MQTEGTNLLLCGGHNALTECLYALLIAQSDKLPSCLWLLLKGELPQALTRPLQLKREWSSLIGHFRLNWPQWPILPLVDRYCRPLTTVSWVKEPMKNVSTHLASRSHFAHSSFNECVFLCNLNQTKLCSQWKERPCWHKLSHQSLDHIYYGSSSSTQIANFKAISDYYRFSS